MSWYSYFAIKQLFPTQCRISFFLLTATGGVTLGVAVLFVVMSVMNGFQLEIEKKIIEFQGDIQIGDGSILPSSEKFSQFLASQPEIKSFTPYANGIVMLMSGDRPIFPMIQGIDWERCEIASSSIKQHLLSGNFENLNEDSIFIFSHLADQLGLLLDSTVELYSPLALEELKEGTVLLPREVSIAGILKDPENTGSPLSILCPLKLMQELYGLGDGIHGYSLYLQPKVDAISYAGHLNSFLTQPYHASSWIENHQELFSALRLEKTMMFFVLLFILLIAAFSVSCALTFNVIKKTREIGLLQALGATSYEIAACFCIQGLIIGILGTINGFAIGQGILTIRDTLLSALSFHWFDSFKYYTHLPVHYKGSDILFILFFTNGISLFAGLFPAWKALRISPAQALRVEN
ncbi:MAG: ABC transporter permease [Puniceicoccales bacterium]|jgi:lipoprotein-releasing system permease protein|nr:ABC transporter permease [Puniceicoccales bacterium]